MSNSRATQLHSKADELIPTVLLRLVFALVLAVLALVTVAKLSGRPLEATPPVAEIIKERAIILSGDSSGSARVLDQHGGLLADFSADKGGFVAGISRSLTLKRKQAGIDPSAPVRLVKFKDGHLGLRDDFTGWRTELIGFGKDNTAVFANLLNHKNKQQ